MDDFTIRVTASCGSRFLCKESLSTPHAWQGVAAAKDWQPKGGKKRVVLVRKAYSATERHRARTPSGRRISEFGDTHPRAPQNNS